MINVFHLILILLCHGLTSVYSERLSVSLMEGDLVMLQSGIERKPQEDIKWYFNNSLIAKVNGDLSDVCTDVQCHEGAERFRGRLKLDIQTGSLTITDTRSTDTGDYQLLINRSGEKIFSVTVHDDSATDGDEVKITEGDSVSLNPGVIRKPSDVLSWFFNNILIAEITGSQSQVCTDDQCKEKFTDRLKLDNENGSLTIKNIRTTDSGSYTLEILRSDRYFSFKREKRFTVTVNALPHSGLSAGVIAAIVIACLLLVGAASVAGGIYWRRSMNYLPAAQDRDDSEVQDDPV